MSTELDTRARSAAAGLRAKIDTAELTSVPPGSRARGHRSALALRPALVAVLLVIGSAVGLALVLESAPPATTSPQPTTPTTVPAPTVPSTAQPYVPPTTTGAVIPVAPPVTTALDTTPPPLTITSPEEGASFDEKTVTFVGTTEPGARVFAGPYEADVSSTGEWQIILVLREGSNLARFDARDDAGNESHAAVTVYYVVAQPAPTTTAAKEGPPTTSEKELSEFTAFATFGSCAETPPYDVYHGTGEPGSTVYVTSEHGSGSVVVGGEGAWETTVVFATAPPGQPFPVKVSDEFGRKTTFEFVYTP